MKLTAFVGLCLIFSIADIPAQEIPKDLKSLTLLPEEPLPSGDLLSRAPQSSQWTVTSSEVTVVNPGKPKEETPKSTVVNFTKSDKIYLVESVGTDGQKVVRWKEDLYQATFVSGMAQPLINNTPTFMADGSVLYYLDFSKADFPEFSWISPRNYVGMVKIGKDSMGMVFKAKIPTKGTQMTLWTMPHQTPAEVIAVVDSQTRRPLMLQVENEILSYQVTDGGAQLALPKDVQKAFNSVRKQVQRAALIPPG